ncbi:hypothetical protein, partial [Pseudomonas aeruginosa]
MSSTLKAWWCSTGNRRSGRQESNARSYPRRIPLALKKARGLLVEDVEGRTFIDCLAG